MCIVHRSPSSAPVINVEWYRDLPVPLYSTQESLMLKTCVYRLSIVSILLNPPFSITLTTAPSVLPSQHAPSALPSPQHPLYYPHHSTLCITLTTTPSILPSPPHPLYYPHHRTLYIALTPAEVDAVPTVTLGINCSRHSVMKFYSIWHY